MTVNEVLLKLQNDYGLTDKEILEKIEIDLENLYFDAFDEGCESARMSEW